MLKHCLKYVWERRFWILLFLSLFLSLFLFVYFVFFNHIEVKNVEYPLYRWLEKAGLEIGKTVCPQKILYEASSILGIAVVIVMGGITVAIPLYLFLWQSITDSMFQVFLTVRKHYLLAKRKKATEAAELKKLMCKTCDQMKLMEEEMPNIRKIFGCSMILSVFMLLMIVMVLISPEEVISYIAATVCAIGSIFLAIMFLYLVFRVWEMEAVRKKFDNQVKLACLINKDDCQ